MKKGRTVAIVISAVMSLVIVATAVFWVLYISKIIPNMHLGLRIAGAVLNVACEIDILFVLIYFTSDKWEKTKIKSVFNIICAVFGAIYSADAILSCAIPGIFHIDNYLLDMLVFYTPLFSIFAWIIIRGLQFLRFIFKLPSKA